MAKLKDIREEIAEMAKENFKYHVIEELTDSQTDNPCQIWKCKKPGTGSYAFRVVSIPGTLIVTGDIGELILSRTRDMITWARESIESIQYFGEKVVHAIPIMEFQADVARASVRQVRSTYRAGTTSAIELENFLACDGNFDHESAFYMAMQQLERSDLGCPDVKGYNANFLWCREALKWFLENTDS